MLDTPNGFTKKTVNFGGRNFSLKLLNFDNGAFISISEGSSKIGSMVVSLNTGQNTVTTTVIPSKSNSLFLKLIAEKISYKLRGISIVSAFMEREIDSEAAKVLMTEIMDIFEVD